MDIQYMVYVYYDSVRNHGKIGSDKSCKFSFQATEYFNSELAAKLYALMFVYIPGCTINIGTFIYVK